jgi:cobalt-zinc-cadmium efflux system membrane fusion protein
MECPPDKKQPFLFHSDHSLAANLIAAPISGTVISRNCVKGERLEEGKVIFQIADLRTVWVDLKIPMTNLNSVKSGDRVLIISNDLKLETYGEISFIFPIVDERTRAAKARIILQNTGQVWKPGTFVSAYLKIDSTKADVVVPLSSIQRIGNEMVVFVPVENGFNTKVVKVGMKDSKNAQIISGLKKGEKFVSEGSFQLKATMVTSGLDPHAGHGH